MSKIFVPSKGPADWRALLANPERHWRTGYSAMCLAASWEASSGLPAEVASLFGDGAELLLAIPEHKVPMPARGAASQCDIFAIVRHGNEVTALVVEGKANEPFDEPLEKWLKAGGQNRHDRLQGICKLLETPYPPPGELRYQLFHRTAAAILEARRFKADRAAMVVHSFSKEHRWIDDFDSFCTFANLPRDRNEFNSKRLHDGLVLSVAWATGSAGATIE